MRELLEAASVSERVPGSSAAAPSRLQRLDTVFKALRLVHNMSVERVYSNPVRSLLFGPLLFGSALLCAVPVHFSVLHCTVLH